MGVTRLGNGVGEKGCAVCGAVFGVGVSVTACSLRVERGINPRLKVSMGWDKEVRICCTACVVAGSGV